MPIFRVQVNMEVDTDKHETRILNQQMIDPVEVKPCPHCGKVPPIGRVYCNRNCFISHGKRNRHPAIEETKVIGVTPEVLKRGRPRRQAVPWYRRILG